MRKMNKNNMVNIKKFKTFKTYYFSMDQLSSIQCATQHTDTYNYIMTTNPKLMLFYIFKAKILIKFLLINLMEYFYYVRMHYIPRYYSTSRLLMSRKNIRK